LGEDKSGYTYVPIDPFTVAIDPKSLPLATSNILASLPDNAVRFSEEEFDSSNNVSYGTSGLSVAGGLYKITIDYINSDTANIRLQILKSVFIRVPETNNQVVYKRYLVPMSEPNPPGYVPNSEWYIVNRVSSAGKVVTSSSSTSINYPAYINGAETADTSLSGAIYNIPVYIGIGLRITVDIVTTQSGLNISGLGAIGGYAEEKSLSGSLVVQTLGINGKSVAANLPIQSDINQTTAQNAIASVGAIKTVIYEPDTDIVPRVVGLYLPFKGGKPLVNAIISALATEPIPWVPLTTSNQGAIGNLSNDGGKGQQTPPKS